MTARPHRPPGATCPAIDRVLRVVRRHVPEPDRSAAVADLEELRDANARLRQGWADAEAAKEGR